MIIGAPGGSRTHTPKWGQFLRLLRKPFRHESMLETSAKLAVLPEAVESLSTRKYIHVSRSLHGALAGTRTLKPLRAMSLSHVCIPIPAQEQNL